MTVDDIEHSELRPRSLSQILDEIAAEALESGDQPILDLVEEASDLLDPSVEPAQRATSMCTTARQREPVTLSPITTRDHATIAPWFQDNEVERWAGGNALLETWLEPELDAQRTEVFIARRSGGQPVAVIGAERTVGETVVALVVNPARRGEGIGTSSLEALAGLPQYRGSLLTCEIASDNLAATLAAGHAGFSEGEPDNDGYITFSRTPDDAEH